MITRALLTAVLSLWLSTSAWAGIVQDEPTDCSLHVGSYGLRYYTVLGARARHALGSWDLWLSLYSGTKLRTIADDVIRELDAMDREIESAKIADGECFGKGAYGEKVAEKYAWVKGIIAEQRMVVEEGIEKVLAKKRTLEKEQINFERWRAENPEDVVRHVGNMKLEIVLIAKRDLFGQPSSNTVITIEATNTTTSKILKPRNQRIYGYEFGSNVGGRYSIGAYLTDSFGNEYKLTSIEPQFMGNEGKGIRPGEIVTFTLRFGDVPLQNAMSVSLAIDPDTLGQQAGAVFELPIEAFYGPL